MVDPKQTKLGFNPEPSGEIWQRWTHGNPTASAIRFGVVTQVNSRGPDVTPNRIQGTIDVLCYDGTREINVQVLSASVSPKTGAGEFQTPYIGSQCCLVTTAGGVCYAVGFIRQPTTGLSFKDGRAKFPTPLMTDAQGDWVRSTNGGKSEFRLTSSGVIFITSTPACRMVLNPLTGEWNMASQIMSAAADGYTVRRGRLPGNQVHPDPRTLSKERFLSTANGTVATHVLVETGSVTGGAVRRISILAGGKVLQGRESVDAGGNFVGAFSTYRYGSSSASENMVLGQVLKQLWSDFLDLFAKHTHQSAMGPTTPPVELAEALELKIHPIEDEAMLSSFMYTQKLGPIPTPVT